MGRSGGKQALPSHRIKSSLPDGVMGPLVAERLSRIDADGVQEYRHRRETGTLIKEVMSVTASPY